VTSAAHPASLAQG